jgi:chromosome partitioning protein
VKIWQSRWWWLWRTHKGGVAKTASTLALAEAAVARGLTVGLIDLDPNCTLTETLEPVDLDAAGSKDLRRDDRDLSLAACLTGAGAQWGGVTVCVRSAAVQSGVGPDRPRQ